MMPAIPDEELKAMNAQAKPPLFVNPYLGYEGPTNRFNAIVPMSVFNRIKCCRLGNGTVQTTINILISKLIYELDRRNITGFTEQREFEQFVAGCQLCDSGANGPAGTTTSQPDRTANVSYERGGPSSVGPASSGKPPLSADVPSNPKLRRKGRAGPGNVKVTRPTEK